MLGAAGDEQIGPPNRRRDNATDKRPCVPRRVDVAVVRHDVAVVANKASPRRLGLCQNGVDACRLGRLQLIGRIDPD